MKTTDEPLDPEKEQKEEATRKKFELLRFGDLTVNYSNTIIAVKTGIIFILRLIAKTQ